MAKGHKEEGKHGKAKAEHAEETVKEAAAETKEAVKDVLTHTEAMARAVEEKVREAAQKTIRESNPAMAAERLVQMAETKLQSLEVEQAHVEKAREERIEAVKAVIEHPIDAMKTATAKATEDLKETTGKAATDFKKRTFKMTDGLVAKAEKRLNALPEPVKVAGRFAEKVVSTALWPAKFGLHLAGEVVRTPIALARILFRRSRTA